VTILRLSVPFHQKDQAKGLGAKWNYQERFWFITEKEDPSLFTEWLPNKNSNINLRANRYYIAQSSRACWKCKFNSQVYAIILPKNGSRPNEYAKVLYYLQYINEGIQRRLEAWAPHYFFDCSTMTSFSYWMNHCQQCKARLGDFETIEEYASPFRPTSIEEAKKINLYFIEEYLEASGESSKSVAFLEYMKIMDSASSEKYENNKPSPLVGEVDFLHCEIVEER
jgi:hypothetical protein